MKPLLAVTVWQKVTYLVRCSPEDAKQAVQDPTARLARVAEGDIYTGDVKKVAVATTEDLEKAIPTNPGITV